MKVAGLPKKRLGQTFLKEPSLAVKIVHAADVSGEDTVVEIGAGAGILTREIAKRAGRVVALEIDPVLVDGLERAWAGDPRVLIVRQDVLKYDFRAPFRERGDERRLKIVGNVPYYITTPIFFRLLAFREVVETAVLMVQKEVALRLTAQPGTKDYGIPTVIGAVFSGIKILFTVPPSCFYPRPKVESAVIRVDFNVPTPAARDEALFAAVVRKAFSRRRKTVWNNLRDFGGGVYREEEIRKALAESGIDISARAETVSPPRFVTLANILSERMIGND